MAYTVNLASPLRQNDFTQGSASGYVDADGTALPVANVTAAANATTLTADTTTGFHGNDYIEVAGGGNSGGTIPYFGPIWSVPNGTSFALVSQIPILAAVSAVPVTPFYRVALAFRPRYVELFNVTTGVTYRWRHGMPLDSAEVTSASGAKTFVATGGIATYAHCFVFHPSLLGVNSRLYWRVEF